MTLQKAVSSAVLNIALERIGKKKKKQKKEVITTRVFVFGHLSKCEPRRTGLNFVEWRRHGAVLMV